MCKTCSRCKVEKDEGDFYSYSNGSIYAACKRCYIESAKHSAEKNPEQVRLNKKKYKEKVKSSDAPLIQRSSKICGKCKVEKPTSDFYLDSGSPDKYSSFCKDCVLKKEREHRKFIKENKIEFVPIVGEKYCSRCDRTLHASQFNKSKYHRSGLSTWCKSCNSEYKKIIRPRIAVQQREYAKNNHSKVRALKLKRYSNEKGSEGSYSGTQWDELFDACGNKCLRCGTNKDITQDHIVPLIQGGTSYIWNMQPLCKSCNSHKYDRAIDYRPVSVRIAYLQPSS